MRMGMRVGMIGHVIWTRVRTFLYYFIVYIFYLFIFGMIGHVIWTRVRTYVRACGVDMYMDICMDMHM